MRIAINVGYKNSIVTPPMPAKKLEAFLDLLNQCSMCDPTNGWQETSAFLPDVIFLRDQDVLPSTIDQHIKMMREAQNELP